MCLPCFYVVDIIILAEVYEITILSQAGFQVSNKLGCRQKNARSKIELGIYNDWVIQLFEAK